MTTLSESIETVLAGHNRGTCFASFDKPNCCPHETPVVDELVKLIRRSSMCAPVLVSQLMLKGALPAQLAVAVRTRLQ
jgi:hypothetical protein